MQVKALIDFLQDKLDQHLIRDDHHVAVWIRQPHGMEAFDLTVHNSPPTVDWDEGFIAFHLK